MKNIEKTLNDLVSIYGEDGKGGAYPNLRQWRACLSSEHTGAIQTFNFSKLRKTALYENGEQGVSGTQAMQRYAECSMRVEKSMEVVYAGAYNGVLMGHDDGVGWDSLALIKFPSLEHWASIFLHPEYIKGVHHRVAAVEKFLMIVSYVK